LPSINGRRERSGFAFAGDAIKDHRVFRLSQNGRLARLTLDRAEARNAIPSAGWGELAERLDTVRPREPRC
jgi:enoyl-CoA hydratase/carnithine racemase